MEIDTAFEEAADKLTQGCVDILPEARLPLQLQKAAQEQRPLRIKFGMDPTSADIHLGHAVVLQQLRMFQDAGHKVVLIIGDYTARVGDPSGRSKARPTVDGEAIDRNAETYQEQAFQILDRDQTEIRYNSEWLSQLSPLDIFNLQNSATVAQLLERDDFARRMKEHAPISLLELLYPLLQGYDSVAVKADVEFGGTDQLFNLLMGRHLQPLYGQTPQSILTMPILTGLDGVEKMSKSLGNYVGITEPPNEMFGKVMSIADDLMPEWYRYAAGITWQMAEEYIAGIEGGTVHPNHAKRTLAHHVIERFYSKEEASAAEARFDLQFKSREVPDDIPLFSLANIEKNEDGRVFLPALMVGLGWAGSNGEARRLIQGGGVKLAGDQLAMNQLEMEPDFLAGKVIQVGKRRFARLAA